MRVSTLAPGQPSAIHDALVRRGIDPVRADATARGLAPLALLFDSIDAADRNALASAARANGLECLTGDGWAMIAGSVAGLACLTRPGSSALQPEGAELVGRLLQGVVQPEREWEMSRGTLSLEQPVVVGILNVTPDSFSDGGRFLDPADAMRHAETMLDAGADILDIGGQSTGPGVREPESTAEEWRRIEPVLSQLTRRFPSVPISVDTIDCEIGRRALDLGVWALNDVSGLRLDPEIAVVCAEYGAGLILMHSRGSLSEMATYDRAQYDDVAIDVAAELRSSISAAEHGGVAAGHIVLDPGLGFAKRPEHNYALLRGLTTLKSLGFPIMVGPSRKRFLGQVTGADVAARDNATAAACVAAYSLGASLFRVHDVARVKEALSIAHAVREA